jgi:hypothetical protein
VLVIQDPTDEQSPYLLESIVDALQGAQTMAGAFAFASAAGIRLLTRDAAFQTVAQNHPIDLVLGIDAVTTLRALDSFTAVTAALPNLRVRAFLNPRPEALFHPKYCWTKNASGGVVIAGSGNLTEGGLLGNWEAYSVERLTTPQIAAVETEWNAWTTTHQAALLPLDNAEVRARAAANNVLAREGDLPTLVAPPATPAPGEEPETTQTMAPTAVVLLAEMPRSADRQTQVNFHLDDYRQYFGAREGETRMMVFRNVRGDGSMGDYERNRPPVTVQSRNFRFELGGAAEHPYPANGRPIGVYIRVATRTFFYRFIFPGDPEFAAVNAILRRRAHPHGNQMLTARMTVAELRREWPTAPFWQLPANV